MLTTRTILLMLVLSLLAAPTRADEKSLPEARRKFQEGIALVAEGAYAAALSAFEDSYRLHPRPSTLFNVGMCLKEIGRHADALEAFEVFLSLPHDDSRAHQVADARKMVAFLAQNVGYLHLEELPWNADLRVDGRPTTSPAVGQPLIVDAGTHTLEISKEGYRPLQQKIEI